MRVIWSYLFTAIWTLTFMRSKKIDLCKGNSEFDLCEVKNIEFLRLICSYDLHEV